MPPAVGKAALVIIGLMAIVLILTAAISAANLPLLGRDFLLFWTAGRAVQTGVSPYDMDFQARTQQANGWDTRRELMPFNPFSYPSWLAAAMSPLAWLPFATAFQVWLSISLVAFTAGILAVLRSASRVVSSRALVAALVGGLTFLPTLNGLSVGQLNLVLFAGVAGMVWALHTERDRLAGVCMGALFTQPHIGIVIVTVVGLGLIAWRRFRPLVWMCLTIGVCAGIAFIISPTWPADMLGSFDRFTALTGWTFPLNGFQDNPTVYATLRVTSDSQPLVFALVLASLACLAALLVRRLRGPARPSLLWLSATACVAVFIFTPYARAYDMILLLWPVLYIAFSDELVVARDAACRVRRGVPAAPAAGGARRTGRQQFHLGICPCICAARRASAERTIAASCPKLKLKPYPE